MHSESRIDQVVSQKVKRQSGPVEQVPKPPGEDIIDPAVGADGDAAQIVALSGHEDPGGMEILWDEDHLILSE